MRSVVCHPAAAALALLLLGAALPGPARATASADLQAGFRLGKLASATRQLAGELHYLQGLAEQFVLEPGLDDPQRAAAASDEQYALASSALSYALWRAELAILPLVQAGQEPQALDHPVLDPLAGPLRSQLRALERATARFQRAAQAGEPDALREYVAWIRDSGCVEALLALADEAGELGGEAPRD